MDDDRVFDDDLVDLVEVIGVIDKLPEPKGYLRDAENPVEFYSDREFIRRFRFNKSTVVNVIVPLLTGPNQNARGLPVPPLIKEVSDELTGHLLEYVKFPTTNQEVERNYRLFWNMYRFPGVSGCIDCTHEAPMMPARIFRNNRMRTRLETRQVKGNLLGDSGYPQLDYLYTPVPDLQTLRAVVQHSTKADKESGEVFVRGMET
uniref:Uncharacterized protein n=1 Tax=Timema douglasi TaxID=61478 RepID=A0A7R8ZDL0_TIMDO|nr:unnamed protein product [Timema douglasi]